MRRKRFFFMALSALVVVLLLTVAFVSIQAPHKNGVAVFHIQRSIHAFSQALSHNHHLDEAAKKQLALEYGKALKVAMHEYATSHHVVILRHKEVLCGGQDITRTIDHWVAKRLAHFSAKETDHD